MFLRSVPSSPFCPYLPSTTLAVALQVEVWTDEFNSRLQIECCSVELRSRWRIRSDLRGPCPTQVD